MNYVKPKRIELPDRTYVKQVPTIWGILVSFIKSCNKPKYIGTNESGRKMYTSFIYHPTYNRIASIHICSSLGLIGHIRFAFREWKRYI